MIELLQNRIEKLIEDAEGGTEYNWKRKTAYAFIYALLAIAYAIAELKKK